MTKVYDPTTVRLSEHFLLSDFMGCNSAYQKGLANPFVGDGTHIHEGIMLCKNLLEPLLDRDRFSISYGYLSPQLSQATVKYQDPNKPSYHRWDNGAAADVAMHQTDEPPVFTAFWVDENTPSSRTISYAESPYICVATRSEEIKSGDPRRALYENRYSGGRKPIYIPYSSNPRTRSEQKRAVPEDIDWVGAGYPTYHGGGTQQAQHIRTSRFTMLSDLLYNPEAVREGYANWPTQRAMARIRKAGELVDQILVKTKVRRVSIVRAYESPAWSDSLHTWRDGIYLIVVPPASAAVDTFVSRVAKIPGVLVVREGAHRRVLIKAEL